MITPKIKDDVLKWLCMNLTTERMVQINTEEIMEITKLDFEKLNSVLSYFDRIGFIEDLNARPVAIFLVLRIEANDMYLRGGFTAQEEILETNINKLLLEIDNLKREIGPNNLETINRLSSIASAVFGGLSLFK